MKRNGFFWLIFIFVTALCWIDYQYFTEGHALQYTALTRQAGHIIIIALITSIGYMGWRYHPMPWLGKLWSYSYATITICIALIGVIQWKIQIFSTEFLDNISSIRLFFTSPVPYFMLYILGRIIQNRTGSTGSVR